MNPNQPSSTSAVETTCHSEKILVRGDYLDKTMEVLKNMKDGERKHLDRTHKSYKGFVDCIKIIIDWELDWDNGFSVGFNNDYSEIRKSIIPNK